MLATPTVTLATKLYVYASSLRMNQRNQNYNVGAHENTPTYNNTVLLK